MTWDELDEFLKKWGKETFGEESIEKIMRVVVEQDIACSIPTGHDF